jgi:UDP-3-O-[3-hydroxymyristoyl] glucosamine N-acyltransferase
MIGGQVGIVGHISIADGTKVALKIFKKDNPDFPEFIKLCKNEFEKTS